MSKLVGRLVRLAPGHPHAGRIGIVKDEHPQGALDMYLVEFDDGSGAYAEDRDLREVAVHAVVNLIRAGFDPRRSEPAQESDGPHSHLWIGRGDTVKCESCDATRDLVLLPEPVTS